MSSIQRIFLESKNKERSGVIWNMAANMIFAFQNPLICVFLRRVGDLDMSGIFALAFSEATLLLMIGKYGMRDFQVSDVKNKYSFFDYRSTKFFTTICMLLASAVYIAYYAVRNSYSPYKTAVIALMCLLKTHDAIEDVYYAHYQKNRRLDIAGKTMFTRLMSATVACIITAVITRNLVISLVVSNLVSAAILVFFIVAIFPNSEVPECDLKLFDLRSSVNGGRAAQIKSILSVGFPLFAGVFLAYYIGVAPKNQIDTQMNDDIQAIYNYLTMPVFVIGVINNFFYYPVMVKISDAWRERNLKRFFRYVWRQVLILCGIEAVCLLGAYILGIPVLSIIFNTDLSPYKTELLLLLVCGGFLAMSDFLVSITTIIRFQKATIIAYIIGGIAAFFMAAPMVRRYGIRGAADTYLLLIALVCVCLLGILIIGYRKRLLENRTS